MDKTLGFCSRSCWRSSRPPRTPLRDGGNRPAGRLTSRGQLTRRPPSAASPAGDDEQVRFWVDQVSAKAKESGKLEMPSPQEVALRMHLSECNDAVPCGERVLNVMGRIAEGVVEKKEIKNVVDAIVLAGRDGVPCAHRGTDLGQGGRIAPLSEPDAAVRVRDEGDHQRS
eukprot:jgi/Mesvir1/658/Mv17270-RA.1